MRGQFHAGPMAVRVLVGLLLVISTIANATQAQTVEGLPPLTAETPLFAHAAGDGATLWMSTLKEDEQGTDETVQLAFPAPADVTPASFKLVPALSEPLYLDPEGVVQFNLRVGSGLLANVGQFSAKLEAGTTLIASGAGPAADAAVSTYKDVVFTATPAVTTITPDMGDLVWTVSFEGAGTVFAQVGQGGQWCNLVLPIVAPPSEETANETVEATNTTSPSAPTTSASPTTSAAPTTTSAAAPTTTSPTQSTNATNETAAPASPLGEEAPGVAGPLVVALILGIAAARRRRRPA